VLIRRSAAPRRGAQSPSGAELGSNDLPRALPRLRLNPPNWYPFSPPPTGTFKSGFPLQTRSKSAAYRQSLRRAKSVTPEDSNPLFAGACHWLALLGVPFRVTSWYAFRIHLSKCPHEIPVRNTAPCTHQPAATLRHLMMGNLQLWTGLIELNRWICVCGFDPSVASRRPNGGRGRRPGSDRCRAR
jgi:hypothetical protein